MEQFREAVKEACESAGVTVAFLQSGSRSGSLPSMRKELARKGVYEYGLSLTETGKQLGVTTNAVSYVLKKE